MSATIVPSNTSISTPAARGAWPRKKIHVHARLSARFAENRPVTSRRRAPGTSRTASVAAIAISTYRTVHTGPKTAPGGCHEGFSRSRYQSLEVSDPIAPAIATPVTAAAQPAATGARRTGGEDAAGTRRAYPTAIAANRSLCPTGSSVRGSARRSEVLLAVRDGRTPTTA